MINSDDPSAIIMDCRTGGKSLEDLTAYIVSLARTCLQISSILNRITALEALPVNVIPEIGLPVRSLDADFIISNTRNALVSYTVDLLVTASILGSHTNDATVDLIVNGTSVAQAKNNLAAVITLGLSMTPAHRHVLSAFIPSGSTVNLTSSVTGTGVATYISAQEILL